MRRRRGAARARESRPIAVVLSDTVEDVAAAAHAKHIAEIDGSPLLLLVPRPAAGYTLDAAILRRVIDRREREAAAIAARTLPTLGLAPADLAYRVVPYRRDPARALRAYAGRVGAAVVVAPAPVLAHLASGRYRRVAVPANAPHAVRNSDPTPSTTSPAHPTP